MGSSPATDSSSPASSNLWPFPRSIQAPKPTAAGSNSYLQKQSRQLFPDLDQRDLRVTCGGNADGDGPWEVGTILYNIIM